MFNCHCSTIGGEAPYNILTDVAAYSEDHERGREYLFEKCVIAYMQCRVAVQAHSQVAGQAFAWFSAYQLWLLWRNPAPQNAERLDAFQDQLEVQSRA